jgi:hypothetical protein
LSKFNKNNQPPNIPLKAEGWEAPEERKRGPDGNSIDSIEDK